MKKMIKTLSLLLTVLMLLGSFVNIMTFAVYADEAEEETDTETELPVEGEDEDRINYTSKVFTTPEEKLEATMQLAYTYKNAAGEALYELYVDSYSGETAVQDLRTGQYMFSNPYNIGGVQISASIKKQLLSQIILHYTENDEAKVMYSFIEAAEREQIKVKKIKNGIRVEYSMGRENPKWLVPRLMSVEAYQKLQSYIDKHIDKTDFRQMFYYNKLMAYYTLQDPNDPKYAGNTSAIAQMQSDYPITKKMAVYACEPEIQDAELERLQDFIKTYAPEYTYEMLDADHATVEYVASDKAPALFRLALEYTFDDFGLSVTLPAAGIRFDETNYKLKSITALPYIGAGENCFDGYLFLPDGSGALIRFEEIVEENNKYRVSSSVYGTDYAYHTLTGSSSTEPISMPVFGLMEKYQMIDRETDTVIPGYDVDNGYFAIITEGDAMANITSESGGTSHPYNSMYAEYYPRPSDTYNLADSISIASDATWTVESSRKYVGNYTVRYIMLSDPDKAAEAGLSEDEYFEASYMGMAKAYRAYLESTGAIKRLTAEDVEENIPLYMDMLGSIETTEKIMSIPVTVDVALTKFEDVKTISEELRAEGITNLNFKLTGFANGGMYSTIPSNLKWESSVGGKGGFNDLLSYAKDNSIGIYPDFDFAYVSETGGGLSLGRDAIKTIDDRYTQFREYDASVQSYVITGKIAISSSVYDYFYERFSKNFSKYNPIGVSAGTMGTALNTDFDKKDPYNREDAKEYTASLLAQMEKDYGSVMIEGGNAYAAQYADHILNVSLDSSKYLNASDSIPFFGLVYHGYVNFTGSPFNMEGDLDYSTLKAIENGAYLQYILAYDKDTVSKLKEDEYLSQYYSLRYDIWKEDVIARYKTLNEALKNLQTSVITDHDYVEAYRIPEDAEFKADIQNALDADQTNLDNKVLNAETIRRVTLLKQRQELAAQGIFTDPAELAAKYDAENPIVYETVDPTKYDDLSLEEFWAQKNKVKESYKVTDRSVVYVEYEGGTAFLLNYNSFDVYVTIDGTTYTVEANDFVTYQK